MSRNYYSEINLHIVWHTKESSPLLTPTVEPVAHRCVIARVEATPGVRLHAIGGIETHIHLCISIPPTLLISEWVGKLKGGSAHDVNEQFGLRQKVIQWQAGYGVVSFGSGDLRWVGAYIRNQREHHRAGSVHQRLETYTDDGQSTEAAGTKPGEPG
jgi:putative transposase